MRFAIAMAAITIILSFKISNDASGFGQAVAQRFLERGNSIPPDISPITKDKLNAWAADPHNATAIYGYVHKILPWDIAFLLCLGCFLGLGSAFLALYANWPKWVSQLPSWWFWTVPCLYMLADLSEDAMIARLLSSSKGIDQSSFDFMRLAHPAQEENGWAFVRTNSARPGIGISAEIDGCVGFRNGLLMV